MVNRRNYHRERVLEHQQDTCQLTRSITRYWFHLKFLLL
jgi:hypothetical protein